MKRYLAILLIVILNSRFSILHSQELQATVNINHQQIQGTDVSVFENLKQTLEQFINDKQWTSLQFQKNERIVCSFNITVTKYDKNNNIFTCTALIQASRPIYNAAYSTTIYNNKDANFDFEFAQFDQLNFNEEEIDNQLRMFFTIQFPKKPVFLFSFSFILHHFALMNICTGQPSKSKCSLSLFSRNLLYGSFTY